MKKKSNIVLIIVFIICLAGVAFLLFQKLNTKEVVDLKALPSVNVCHVKTGNVEKEIAVMGTILPNDTYYVPAKVGGDIVKIFVHNGDHVKKGDPICEIDASKEIEAAFIQYDTAKKSHDRYLKLYKAGDISAANYEQAKMQYDSAKLAYDTKVEYTIPVAVADGVVENTDMIMNTSIKAEKVLCYITSEEAKEINFGVTERVLHGLSLGDSVVVEKNGTKYDGLITDIAKLISSSTGLFNVKATIISENNFASGVMAKVTCVYDKKEDVQTLPNEVVYYEAGNAYIYVVNSEGVLEKRYIDVGIEDEFTTEIITPIEKSEKIVATWNNDLADGVKVNIITDVEE